jgi:hypothetical protein
MTYRLAIIDPPEADFISFAVACIPAYGAAQLRRVVNTFLNLFTIARYIENATYFVLPLVSDN